MRVIEYPERDETLYVEHINMICPQCGRQQFCQVTKRTSGESCIDDPVALRQYIELVLSKKRDEALATARCFMCGQPLHANNQ